LHLTALSQLTNLQEGALQTQTRLRLITASTVAIMLAATTGLNVLASEGRGHGHRDDDSRQAAETTLVTPPSRPTDSARPDRCDDDEWKNHGEYVSCIARDKDGDEDGNHGQRVREAAHSDIGKPHGDDDAQASSDDDGPGRGNGNGNRGRGNGRD
jgi:hypothetical protein